VQNSGWCVQGGCARRVPWRRRSADLPSDPRSRTPVRHSRREQRRCPLRGPGAIARRQGSADGAAAGDASRGGRGGERPWGSSSVDCPDIAAWGERRSATSQCCATQIQNPTVADRGVLSFRHVVARTRARRRPQIIDPGHSAHRSLARRSPVHDRTCPGPRSASSSTATAAPMSGVTASIRRNGCRSVRPRSCPPAKGASSPAQPHPVKTTP